MRSSTASHFIFTALKLHGYSQKKILLLDLILVAEDHFHHKLYREPNKKLCAITFTVLERSVKAMKIKLLDVEYKELSIVIWPQYSSLLVCTKVGLDE